MLQHHGEEVFAGKALGHFAGVRRNRQRVAVVDHHRVDTRAELRAGRTQQVVADGVHIDQPLVGVGAEVGALQQRVIATVRARAGEQEPAGRMSPRAYQRRQAAHRPHRIGRTAHALHAVVQPDGHRLPGARGLAICPSQRCDLRGLNTADRSGAFRRPLQGACAQVFPAQGVFTQVVVVQPVVGDELLHQAQRQRGVGTRQQGDVFVAFVGGFGAARVDAHQPCAAPFGLLGISPEMQVAADGVAAPDQDQPRVDKLLHPHADFAAQGVRQTLSARCGTYCALQLRRAQPVEKAYRHRLALHVAHGARVAVGQHGLLQSARGQVAQARGNIVQRHVPAHGLKLARAFGADAAHGLQDAVGVVGAFGVARHLSAQRAAGLRVRRVTVDLDSDAIADGGDHGAGVRAVVWAGADDFVCVGWGGDRHGGL